MWSTLSFFLFLCFANCFQTWSGCPCHWNTLVIINTCQWISLLANRQWKAVTQGLQWLNAANEGILSCWNCSCVPFLASLPPLSEGFLKDLARRLPLKWKTLEVFTVSLKRAWGGLSRGGLTRDYRIVRGTASGNPPFGFQATGSIQNALLRYYPSKTSTRRHQGGAAEERRILGSIDKWRAESLFLEVM